MEDTWKKQKVLQCALVYQFGENKLGSLFKSKFNKTEIGSICESINTHWKISCSDRLHILQAATINDDRIYICRKSFATSLRQWRARTFELIGGRGLAEVGEYRVYYKAEKSLIKQVFYFLVKCINYYLYEIYYIMWCESSMWCNTTEWRG